MVSTLENKTLILKVMLCQARNMIMQNRSEVNIRVSGQQNNDLDCPIKPAKTLAQRIKQY